MQRNSYKKGNGKNGRKTDKKGKGRKTDKKGNAGNVRKGYIFR